jgi:GntR family transcriptional regulator/MocR family aminotransferase
MTGNRTSSPAGVELLVTLDRGATAPMHRQVEAAIRDAIRTQRLRRGAVVPSSRSLAADLGVSRGVVVEAYQQLVAEGYLAVRPGGATTVAPVGAVVEPTAAAGAAAPVKYDLQYGRPDVTQFPRAAWLRSARRVINEAPAERLLYLDGRGAPELRTALADYLNRVRGTWADPANLLICNGFAQGLHLAGTVLPAAGVRVLAVEDPSFDDVRSAASLAGLRIVGVPVTAGGLDVAALERSGADAVLITPAHQLTGAVLSPPARAELIRWAQRGDRWVLEDDYDAEFRYTQSPVGALQGLCPDRVLYMGSASKTLAPGLRLGWLVAPMPLVGALSRAKTDADRGSPAIDQLIFADFLERGEYDRHLRRMRPIYRRRRDALLSALRTELPAFAPVGVSAGLHLMARLPPGVDEDALVRAAAARGVAVTPLHPHRMTPGDGAVVFGFARLGERAITEAVTVLAAAVRPLLPGE